MDAGRLLPDTAPPLSKPLAVAYLVVVALVWLSSIAGAVLAIATGRTSWSTHNPWIALPGVVVIASAVGVLWLVDRRLHEDRPRGATAFRMLGLAYGWAVPAAWRRLG
jgi:membrane protein YdbS with pleckstrin-like domain